MTTTPDIALELAEVRRLIDVGFAESNGKLNLLVASDERTNATVEEVRKRLEAAEVRVSALEKAKWLALGAGGALGGGAGGLIQFLGGGA